VGELAVVRKLYYSVVVGKPGDYYFLTKVACKHLPLPAAPITCELFLLQWK
jgi:hypothetical protein